MLRRSKQYPKPSTEYLRTPRGTEEAHARTTERWKFCTADV